MFNRKWISQGHRSGSRPVTLQTTLQISLGAALLLSPSLVSTLQAAPAPGGNSGGARTVTATKTAGDGDVAAQPSGEASWNSIFSHLSATESKLSLAKQSGAVSQADGESLSESLVRLAERAKSERKSSIVPSFSETLSVLGELRTIDVSLSVRMKVSGETQAALDQRIARLNEEVEEAKRDGKVNDQQYLELKSEIAGICEIETAFKGATAGDLKPEQVKLVWARINDVSELLLVDALQSSDCKLLTAWESECDSRLGEAAKSGRISKNQNEVLRAELKHIKEVHEKLESPDGGMTEREIMMLAGSLDDLNSKLDALERATKAVPAEP